MQYFGTQQRPLKAMINLIYAEASTPSPGIAWRQLSDADRRARVTTVLRDGCARLGDTILVVAANADGEIIVNLTEPLSAGERGQVLLDIEDFLKATIDPGLTVWLEPLGDRNSLRNLRGSPVKS
ncbi:MAG: hypothetical protein ACYCOR_21320 [Acidobacteriaceae bacterium]